MLKILFIEKELPERILIQSRIPDYCYIITIPELDDLLGLLHQTEADMVLIGPSVKTTFEKIESLSAVRTCHRVVILSRELAETVNDSSTINSEVVILSKNFERLQEIIDEIARDKLVEITSSAEYKLNRKMSSLIGSSEQITGVKDRIVKYGPAPGPVLITGESGTGKDIIARLLHDFSERSENAFHAVNAGAIPKDLSATELFGSMPGAYTGAIRRSGVFEYADRGTLFLDEIAELDAPVQAELLRVLETGRIRRVGANESKPTDVRLISATNSDIAEAVDSGAFRSDLLFRIDMFRIHIAPLRERKEDIPDLLMFFSEQLRLERPKKYWDFSDSFLDRLFEYSWPGNVRELRNVFRRAVYTSDNEILTADSIRYEY